MARRNDIDWEAVERDYRIGRLSIRELAKTHKVAVSSIQAKAKERGWSRDMTETVRVATKAALIEASQARANNLRERADEIGTQLGREIGTQSTQTLEGAVCSAVTENVSLVLRHQSALAMVAEGLMLTIDQLNDQARNAESIERIAELLAVHEPEALPALYKHFGLSARVSSYKSAMEALAKLIDKQRQAFGIKDEHGSGDDDHANLLRRLKLRMAAEQAAEGDVA